jgi:uncharacterized protein (TIGR03437 family)
MAATIRPSTWIVVPLITFFSFGATTPAVAATTAPVLTGVVNGANFLPRFSQGSWVTITGANLSGTTRTWTSADFNGTYLPTSLDQVSVTIDGKPAYVYYISPTQINALAPADTATGSLPVRVTYAGTASNVLNATEATFSPALFTFSALSGKYVAAVRSDGQYIGPTALYSGATTPAKVGDTLLLFGTGFGPTNPTTDFSQTFSGTPVTANAVTATIGGVAAAVSFAGLVDPGEYQFNITVPSVPAGDNLVVLTVDGVSSQANANLTVSGSSSITATTVTVAASSTSPTYGNTVTLTATVSPEAATGTVTFYDGTTSLGTGIVSSGSATLTTSSLAVGTHTILASYGGSSIYAACTSNTIPVVVASASSKTFTTTTLTVSPATPYTGTTVVLTAAVSSTAATGTVTFYKGSTSLGTGTLASGTATLTTSFSTAGAYALTATYGGDSTYTSSTSSSVTGTVSSRPAYSLDFSLYSYTTGSMSVTTGTGTYSISYRLYQNIVYVTNPVDVNLTCSTSSSSGSGTPSGPGAPSGPGTPPGSATSSGSVPCYEYQSMNVFVPVSINGTSVTTANVPILLDINVAGYTSTSTWGGSQLSTDGQYALAYGYVVVSPGCRGRDLTDSSGNYIGKAPAAIVDLKSAVRYIRYNYNAGTFPGNANKIVSSGGSAGAALSSLLGASGNSSLYDSYFAALGSAYAADNILAVSAYSPITNLDHADMSYEWEYGGVDYSGALVNQTYSGELKNLFVAYQNGLALTGDNGFGTITANNIDTYILNTYLIPSANQYLAALSSSALTSYLSQHTWITWSGSTASFAFADYVSYIGRSKGLPAFDAFDLTSPNTENYEFGDSTTNAKHFTHFSLQNDASNPDPTATIPSDEQTIVNMMNPMYFIGIKNSSIAQYWFIRDGAKATDTSCMVIIDLATSLENLLGSSHVNTWEYWDGGHAVNLDPDAFIAWVAGFTE